MPLASALLWAALVAAAEPALDSEPFENARPRPEEACAALGPSHAVSICSATADGSNGHAVAMLQREARRSGREATAEAAASGPSAAAAASKERDQATAAAVARRREWVQALLQESDRRLPLFAGPPNRGTQALIPTLMVAGLTCTLLVFVVLGVHQCYHNQLVSGRQQPDEVPPLPRVGARVLGDSAVGSQQTLPPMGLPAASESPGAVAGEECILCAAVVVPPGKRLVCLVERRLLRAKQDVEFTITSSASRGRASLMRARALELQASAPELRLEQLNGELLGSVSTAPLWELGPDDSAGEVPLGFCNASGELLCILQKRTAARGGPTYELISASSKALVFRFSGDFQLPSIQVDRGPGKPVATVEPSGEAEGGSAYQVTLEASVDAGLVLLGLLAIEKCEVRPPRERLLGEGGSPMGSAAALLLGGRRL